MDASKGKGTLYDLIATPPPETLHLDAAPAVRKIYEDLLAKFASGEYEVLDLDQDIILMRAIIIDFINRWNDFSDALIAWYLDQRGKPPDKILDISQAATMLEQVSRVAKRMHEIRQTSSINLATVREMMDKMALILAKHVTDVDLLRAISDDWEKLTTELQSGS